MTAVLPSSSRQTPVAPESRNATISSFVYDETLPKFDEFCVSANATQKKEAHPTWTTMTGMMQHSRINLWVIGTRLVSVNKKTAGFVGLIASASLGRANAKIRTTVSYAVLTFLGDCY